MTALTAFWTVAVGVVLICEGIDETNHADNLLRSLAGTYEKDEKAILRMQNINIRDRVLGYGGMWLIGLGGIALFARHLQSQINRRREAERQLQEAHDRLEQRIAERTAELADANRRLEDEVIERRQAEQWLLESEERFRGYFEQGLVGMAMLSARKEWVEVNERLCRMLGYTEDELMLVEWDALTHPDDLQAENSQFQTLLEGTARGFLLEKRFLRKGGEILSVDLSAQCLRKPDGTIDSVLILVRDAPHGR